MSLSVRASLVVIALAAVGASGCTKARAQALPDVPLDVPSAPPRMVEIRDPEQPPIIPLQPDSPPQNTPVRPRPTPTPRTDNRPAEARPEAPDPPRQADEAGRTPTPTLQTTPTQQDSEAERRVRAQLSQATTDLNRINIQALNSDARLQFDTARRFVTQAEDAIRARNLVFAANLAEKAAALASQLSGR